MLREHSIFPAKKKKSRLIFWVLILVFCLVILVLTAVLYFVFYSEALKVKNFELVGSRLVSKDVLVSALTSENLKRTDFLKWLGPENMLFWMMNPSVLVLKNIAAVKDVEITTDFGGKSVKATVRERSPYGILCEPSGEVNQCYVFDDAGIIFSPAAEVQGFLILKINDKNKRNLVLGGSILPKSDWVSNVFETVKIMAESGLKVSEVALNDLNLEEWEARIANGPLIYFNLNFIPSDLKNILRNLAEKFNLGELTYIDLRVPNRIYQK